MQVRYLVLGTIYYLVSYSATFLAVFLTLLILYGSKMYQLWQLYKANKSDDNIVKGGLRKKKDELTDSWAVHSVSKTAVRSLWYSALSLTGLFLFLCLPTVRPSMEKSGYLIVSPLSPSGLRGRLYYMRIKQ